MKQPIRRIGALLLCAAAALSLFGCTPADETVLATINDEKIYRWEVDMLYAQNASAYGQAGEMVGGEAVDLEDPDNYLNKREVLQALLDSAINNRIVYLGAIAEGYGLSGEERAALTTEVEQYKENAIQRYMVDMFAGESDARAKAEDYYLNTYLPSVSLTPERILQYRVQETVTSRFLADMALETMETQYAEEDVYQAYLDTVEQQKVEYAKDPARYATDVYSSKTKAFYAPYEAKRIRYLRVPYPDGVMEELAAQEAELQRINDELYDAAQSAMVSTTEELQGLPGASDLFAAYFAAEEKISELNKKGADESEQAARDLYARVTAENFDELVDTAGFDEAMKSYDSKQFGIIVYEGAEFPENFIETAMALKDSGEISQPIKTDTGWYILRLMETLPEGPVPYESLREHILLSYSGQVAHSLINQYAINNIENYQVKRNLEKLT